MLTLDDLLKESADKPNLYNKISNILYKDFNIKSAETTLVVLHVFDELTKKEVTDDRIN